MADLRPLLEALAAGRLSRRTFMQRATALGLSTSLAGVLAARPSTALGIAPTMLQASAGPGPATEKLTFSAFNVDQAPLNIQNGDMDLYLFGLKSAGARELESNPQNVRLIQAPASTLSLILNPAPAREGELNPFSIREIRQAMQFLVDRDFIANDIYQGRAVPMITHVSPLDYDELTVFETVRALNIRYDAELAKQFIAGKMQEAGATPGGDGKWTFNGNPIVLKIITRVEDERRDIGDLVRAALEDAGFTTQPLYQPFGPATLAVYTTDPVAFEWHVYTEGWGRTSPDRYDAGSINQFAAPWLGNMPGWQLAGYWQYDEIAPPELDAWGQRLYRGEFTSKEERDQLYRDMTGLALNESVRVWLVTALQSFPVRTELQEVTEDLVGGPKSPLTLREAYIDGRPEIKVGHLWVWTERTTWNPVGGFGDVYSSDIYKNIVDGALINHPFTGIPQPFRAGFEVETAGPDSTLAVPEDAVRWDAAADAWTPVGAGVTAISKVTFDYAKYFQSTWHHGQPITPADLVYGIAQGYEIAYDDQKIQIETALGITSRPILETFVGYKLLEDNRFEVYVNYWHFEPNYIAAYATPSSIGAPWEILAGLSDLVYVQRTAAYTDTTAARFSVPWISLVTESDSRLLLRTLEQFGQEGRIPAGVFEIGGRSLVTAEEAAARYQACQDWFAQYNMLVISQGPFFLSRYDPAAQYAELSAFRQENYPFKPGDWRFGAAPRLVISATQPAPGTVGQELAVPVTVQGPGTLSLKYVLVDPAAGTVTTSGDAVDAGGGNFTVTIGADVTANLFPSIYQLYLLASSTDISQVAEQRLDLEIA